MPLPLKVKMTVDDAIAFADEWIKGCKIYEVSRGWRVACALLADEVRRLRDLVLEQKANIEALNLCVGGDGSTTTNNIIRKVRLQKIVDKLRAERNALQARIDELMLEYCPGEMTPEQVETWIEHQEPLGAEFEE